MKAIRIHSHGGPEVLQYEDAPDPQPGPGQALVKLEAIGVNFTDVYTRIGLYPSKLPLIPGVEGAGQVAALGPGVTEVKAGDRVAYTGAMGSYAQFAVVPAWRLVPLPQGVDAQRAAAVLLQGMTAHYLAHTTFPLQKGHTALVHAGAGGVGLLLIQMAVRLGATVFATVSTPEKAALARGAGAHHTILYTQQDFEQEVHRLTDGQGVQVVYDSVGKDTFDKSLKCLAPRGYLVLYGQSSGVVPPISPLVLSNGSKFLTRPILADYTATRQELLQRAADVFRWVQSGELKVRVFNTFPLSQAAEAHRLLEGRHTTGKLLLLPP